MLNRALFGNTRYQMTLCIWLSYREKTDEAPNFKFPLIVRPANA